MPEPERLSSQAHWDQVHDGGRRSSGRARYLAAVLGQDRYTYLYEGGYAAYFEREVLVAPHVRRGARILEVGSAPGLHLAKLARRLGLDPWGMDYSPEGVAANQATFARFGFDPGQVILGDFFDDDFLDQHRAGFDVVISRGFIEHFRDVRSVIARHVALVRPGGLLVVSIPNLSGINRRLCEFFHPAILDAHNLDIMNLDAYAELFTGQGLTQLHCGYVGVFQSGLQTTPPGSPRRYLLAAARLLQPPLELLQRRLFPTASPQLAGVSPYLIYAGRVDP
ncbi:MAG: class I SAM-dependent methyltransferase [Kofleriaceae bacterium]